VLRGAYGDEAADEAGGERGESALLPHRWEAIGVREVEAELDLAVGGVDVLTAGP
jgi:hypothetical protein